MHVLYQEYDVVLKQIHKLKTKISNAAKLQTPRLRRKARTLTRRLVEIEFTLKELGMEHPLARYESYSKKKQESSTASQIVFNRGTLIDPRDGSLFKMPAVPE